MSSLALKQQPSSTPLAVKVMDIGEDGHDFALFKSYPFFVDVLESIEGTRPFQNIRHSFEQQHFEAKVLPVLLKRLRKEGLVRFDHGRVELNYNAVLLRNMPRDPWINCEMASSTMDETIRRCLEERLAPTTATVRTKASPFVIAGWKRRLRDLLTEIDNHNDQQGESLSFFVLDVEGA